MMKKILLWIVSIPLSLVLAVFLIPSFYALLLMMMFVLPPLLLILSIFEDREEYKVRTLREAAIRFYLVFILLPLGLLAFAAPLRSIILAACSFYLPALLMFNEVHQPFYDLFIPRLGELFPFWLDFYWGIYGVCVIFGLALMDSIRRNMLVTQIENLPTSRAHSAAIGLVELKGQAVPVDKSQDGPIIRSWIEESGDGFYSSRTSATPFYLDDGSGRVLIDPEDCKVDSSRGIFDIKLHHAILRQHTKKGSFPEGRLMPGDEVYVMGNLQINKAHNNGPDKVIIKPQKSTLVRPEYYDLFFVSNISEEQLLAAFKKTVTRGWSWVFALLVITCWLSIYAWTNIAQIKNLDPDAAPALFRLVTTKTDLERQFAVWDLGTHPTIHWLELLKQGHDRGHDIMQALQDQQLEALAVPILRKQAVNIDHPAFGMANDWLQKLDAAPEGHWGHEYWQKEYVAKYEKTNQTFVYRILLNYKRPQLFASYCAYFGEVKSSRLELTKRYVVFEFTSRETGIVKQMEFFSRDGWNEVDSVEVFANFLPGEYSFDVYAKRVYRIGAFDKGSQKRKAIDIKF